MNEQEFWQPLIDNNSHPNHVVVNGEHYTIKSEAPSPRAWRGFRGDRYQIRFFDGREVTTTNLWCQGEIPERFRERLPDNAEFVKEARHSKAANSEDPK